MTLANRWKLLLDVKAVLDEAEVPFWIDFGTLLGFYRQGEFLETDPDIDIGVHREHQDKVIKLVDKLAKIGKVVARVDIGEIGTHYLAGYKIVLEDFWLDIAFFWDAGDKYILPISEWPRVMTFDKDYYDDQIDLKIKGINFKMPRRIEDYMVLHYGKDWKVPFVAGQDYDLHACLNVEPSDKYIKYLK